jgi:hypothetical protein
MAPHTLSSQSGKVATDGLRPSSNRIHRLWNEVRSHEAPHPIWVKAGLLGRLVPLVEAVLQLLGSGFRRIRAVDHVGGFRPGFVF